MSETENIYPIFDRVVQRSAKEQRLGQHGHVFWFYGLSGSGKSTLAVSLEHTLHNQGIATHLLDGDNVRAGLNKGLGFSDEDRAENIRRVAEVARLFVDAGLVVLCSFITPQRRLRQVARGIIGSEDFTEIYVHADYETCAQRDPKGLYAKVQGGKVAQFTGKDSGFEKPEADDTAWVIDTETSTPSICLEQLYQRVMHQVRG